LLHYRDRKNRVHIFTMDRLLLEDVRDRIAEHSGTRSVQIVTPGSVRSAITAEDVMELARDSVTSRVLIMDVRRQTLTRLQQAFSSVVRFNRADLNRYCYAVLIGEGPVNLLKPGRGLRAFPTYLADLRNNFNAAVFFGDPFLTHTHEEIQEIGLRERGTLPDRLPRRFKKFFSDDQVLIEQVRQYFRAAGSSPEKRSRKKEEREEVLRRLTLRMMRHDFPDDWERASETLSKEGLSFPGEPLRFCVYPFFFEEWVSDLLAQARSAK